MRSFSKSYQNNNRSLPILIPKDKNDSKEVRSNSKPNNDISNVLLGSK